MAKQTETKKELIETHFNKWVKIIPTKQKKIFKEEILNHQFLWNPNKTKPQKEKTYNNWRYVGLGEPSFQAKLWIYVTMLKYIDLKISSIFPDIDDKYVAGLLDLIKEINSKWKRYEKPDYKIHTDKEANSKKSSPKNRNIEKNPE